MGSSGTLEHALLFVSDVWYIKLILGLCSYSKDKKAKRDWTSLLMLNSKFIFTELNMIGQGSN